MAKEQIAQVAQENRNQVMCPLCKGKGYIDKEKLEEMAQFNIIRTALKEGGKDVLELMEKYGFQKIIAAVEKKQEEVWSARLDKETQQQRSTITELMKSTAELKQEKDMLLKANAELQSKAVKIGQKGELDFKEWLDGEINFECSEKLDDSGDYIIRIGHLDGTQLKLSKEMLVDVKKEEQLSSNDVKKIIRDAKRRNIRYAYLLLEDEDNMRPIDWKERITETEGILLFRGSKRQFMADTKLIPLLMKADDEYSDKSEYEQKYADVKGMILAEIKNLDSMNKHLKDISKAKEKMDEILSSSLQKLRNLFV